MTSESSSHENTGKSRLKQRRYTCIRDHQTWMPNYLREWPISIFGHVYSYLAQLIYGYMQMVLVYMKKRKPAEIYILLIKLIKSCAWYVLRGEASPCTWFSLAGMLLYVSMCLRKLGIKGDESSCHTSEKPSSYSLPSKNWCSIYFEDSVRRDKVCITWKEKGKLEEHQTCMLVTRGAYARTTN